MTRTPGKSRQRRRIETEERLQRAIEELICENGVESLGVNAVAAKAGVDKALIYRYFGGLEGLVRAYAEGADFWPTVDEVLGSEREVLALDEPAKVAAEIFRRQSLGLRQRPVTLEILARECVARGPLTSMLDDVRERRTSEMFSELLASDFDVDSNELVLSQIFSAAINYLAIRSRFISMFGGVDLRTEEGWESIISVIETVFRALRQQRPPHERLPDE